MNIHKLKKKICDGYYLDGGFLLRDSVYQFEIREYSNNGYMMSTLFTLGISGGDPSDSVRLVLYKRFSEESIKNIEKKVLKELSPYMSFQYNSYHNTFWGDLNIDCKDVRVFYKFIELMAKKLFEFCKEELD